MQLSTSTQCVLLAWLNFAWAFTVNAKSPGTVCCRLQFKSSQVLWQLWSCPTQADSRLTTLVACHWLLYPACCCIRFTEVIVLTIFAKQRLYLSSDWLSDNDKLIVVMPCTPTATANQATVWSMGVGRYFFCRWLLHIDFAAACPVFSGYKLC